MPDVEAGDAHSILLEMPEIEEVHADSHPG
jgi:hypothetical protein